MIIHIPQNSNLCIVRGLLERNSRRIAQTLAVSTGLSAALAGSYKSHWSTSWLNAKAQSAIVKSASLAKTLYSLPEVTYLVDGSTNNLRLRISMSESIAVIATVESKDGKVLSTFTSDNQPVIKSLEQKIESVLP